jgi:alpha-ketoglutarate-dependent taurine dioxygenase
MNHQENDRSAFDRFKATGRKLVRLSQESLVTMNYLTPELNSPLVIQPNLDNINLMVWAENNRPVIEEQLSKHGAILFRNFDVKSVDIFDQVINATSGEALEYGERSSPRRQVSGNIYTSTDHPADQSIFLHNEQSYNLTFPLRIFFCCICPARARGETPIADSRKVLQRINVKVRERFMRKGYMYVRNFGDGFGLTWQVAFQTTDKAMVESYCRKNNIEFEWKNNNRLRTRQVRRTIAKHPRTGELVWFNHLAFFHVSTLETPIREALLSQFKEEDLPNNTYYGDGSPIEQSILDEVREAYLKEKNTFPWQEGDILMLDNMLTAHGREPFEGPRKVVVGMAEPCNWETCGTEQAQPGDHVERSS